MKYEIICNCSLADIFFPVFFPFPPPPPLSFFLSSFLSLFLSFHYFRSDTYLQFKMAGMLSPYARQRRDSCAAINKKKKRKKEERKETERNNKGGPLSTTTNRGPGWSYRTSLIYYFMRHARVLRARSKTCVCISKPRPQKIGYYSGFALKNYPSFLWIFIDSRKILYFLYLPISSFFSPPPLQLLSMDIFIFREI